MFEFLKLFIHHLVLDTFSPPVKQFPTISGTEFTQTEVTRARGPSWSEGERFHSFRS